MTKAIGIIGTLDTKWSEIAYVKTEIERRGCRGFLIDVGVFSDSSLHPEVSAEEVAAAGGPQLADVVAVPAKYKDRLFYRWNPNVTLMRTSVEENTRMGEMFAGKLNRAIGPVAVMIPMGGFSEVNYPGQPFWCPEADQAFVDSLRKYLRPDIPIEVCEKPVNDPEFSSRAAERLLELINQKPEHKGRSAQRNSQTTVKRMKTINRLTSPILAFVLVTAAVGRVESEAVDPAQALAGVQEKVLSKGPNGEEPSPASSVSLTAEEVERIRGLKAKAAIVMHYTQSDWSQAQVAGLRSQFDKMGIDVLAVTDAGFQAEKQVADIEMVLAQNPQIIVSIPTDSATTAVAYKKASQKGVKLVFMDNVPQGFEVGKDYVSVVSADNYGNGVASAHLMAKALRSTGEIGLVYYAADFFVTRQRYDAFKKTITEDYPGIKIVAEQGVREPDFFDDANKAALSMLAANRNLNGIWAVWDLPAEGVMSAAQIVGRRDLVITTIDLGLNVAVDMAQNGLIKGVGAQLPYDQGVTEALLAGYGLLGKPAPAYVALPALPVTRENLLDAWKTVYHTEAPASVKNRMK